MASKSKHSALEVWTTGWHWEERITNFTPSWFTVNMGTGIVTQLLVNFPYPTQWLRNLGYCFWILDICLYAMFTVFLVLRYSWYPVLLIKTFNDFSQSNYLGAIAIGFNTIIMGIISYYNYRESAMWVAYGMWWFSVALTLAVSLVAVFVMFVKQEKHELEEITAVWLLSFIPMIVTSATGGALLPYIRYPNNVAVLVVSFLLWSAGESICFIIITIYLWRLTSCNLPTRDAIVSCCIGLGPFGMGAYSIQLQAVFLSQYIKGAHFAPTQSEPPPLPQETLLATAEGVHWLGIIVALALIGHCTFWFVESFCNIIFRIPKSFNIGFWAFTFPLGVYALGLSNLSKDIRNNGFKGYAAAISVLTVLFWLMCAVGTVYKGFWKGELFYAPGLEDWIYDYPGEGKRQKKPGEPRKISKSVQRLERMQARKRTTNSTGGYSIDRQSAGDEEKGHANGHAGPQETDR
ncbi:Voltage-dependent anion channel [Lasallia pustulata]|uniref:Voltage-dependent anion channel n=1 Tax=Lasallia pustulata TaxID=136370 RepID=A0A1W5CYS3_9LECA|nr:Voltage-dependent anion channel [Lasallia pustulata]